MFNAFPIIMLTDQFDAINHAIVENQLSRDDVIRWLNWYGEVVRQNQDHPVRSSMHILEAFPVPDGMPEHYIFVSRYGYYLYIRISEKTSKIGISSPLGGFPWERKRRFRYEDD